MTYIPTWTGFLNLAMVIGVSSRKAGRLGLWRAHDSRFGASGTQHGIDDQKPHWGVPDQKRRDGRSAALRVAIHGHRGPEVFFLLVRVTEMIKVLDEIRERAVA